MSNRGLSQGFPWQQICQQRSRNRLPERKNAQTRWCRGIFRSFTPRSGNIKADQGRSMLRKTNGFQTHIFKLQSVPPQAPSNPQQHPPTQHVQQQGAAVSRCLGSISMIVNFTWSPNRDAFSISFQKITWTNFRRVLNGTLVMSRFLDPEHILASKCAAV